MATKKKSKGKYSVYSVEVWGNIPATAHVVVRARNKAEAAELAEVKAVEMTFAGDLEWTPDDSDDVDKTYAEKGMVTKTTISKDVYFDHHATDDERDEAGHRTAA